MASPSAGWFSISSSPVFRKMAPCCLVLIALVIFQEAAETSAASPGQARRGSSGQRALLRRDAGGGRGGGSSSPGLVEVHPSGSVQMGSLAIDQEQILTSKDGTRHGAAVDVAIAWQAAMDDALSSEEVLNPSTKRTRSGSIQMGSLATGPEQILMSTDGSRHGAAVAAATAWDAAMDDALSSEKVLKPSTNRTRSVTDGRLATLSRSATIPTGGLPGNVSMVEKRQINIVYSIQTSLQGDRPERLEACLSTWASDLAPGHLQIIGGSSPKNTSSWAVFDPAASCEDSHASGACKDAVGLVNGLKSGADWVVLVGDDNYVVVGNMERELAKLDPETPYLLGIKGCGVGKAGCKTGLCGGGGQIFSRAALRHLVRDGQEAFLERHAAAASASASTYCPSHGQQPHCSQMKWGDVANCVMASQDDIPSGPLAGLHGWHLDDDALRTAVRSTNPKPLTFHYVGPAEMRKVHTLLQAKFLVGGIGELGYSKTYYSRMADYVRQENAKRFPEAEALE